MFKIKGTLKLKQAEQQVSDKFKKREFVLTESSSQYPQMLLFQLTQERCNLIENINEGDEIEVSFNLRGREWTNQQNEVKYFNSLEAWKIDTLKSSNNPSTASSSTINESGNSSATSAPVSTTIAEAESDDLPF